MHTFAQKKLRPQQASLGQRERLPLFASLQTKLTVASPEDAYEGEADRIANDALASPAHAESSAPPAIQRFSAQEKEPAKAAPAGLDQVLANPGAPLPAALRGAMEQRFGYDFSRVRIHVDAAAEKSARALNANAYTIGHNIAFGAGRFAPWTSDGRRLLAHELVHVVQQSKAENNSTAHIRQNGGVPLASASVATPVIQRDTPADTKTDEGQVLTVVIRAPDDKYTQNVTAYVRNTLNDQNIIEVDNLQEIFPYLEKIKNSNGPKLKKIRLIAHGSNIGGIKMKMPGKKDREFVNPAELEKIAEDKNLQGIAAGAMAPDSAVEFYGCYVGVEPTTEIAMSTLFQSEFRSTEEALHTEDLTFVWNGKPITSTAEIDKIAAKDKKAKPAFEDYLLKVHKQLVAAGDIPDAGSRDDKIAAMRQLFDRSQGSIKQLVIQKKSGEKVRATQGKALLEHKWKVN